jgi:SAM-dependent methyltransferase
MRYASFDYHPAVASVPGDQMQAWWGSHWTGQERLDRDLTKEPLWPTIADILAEPGLVLEAGCGYGQWVYFLEKRGHTVVGLDYAGSGLAGARRHNPALRLMQADFRRLPFPSNTFDYVVSLGAIEHDGGGPEAALREFHRALKPSGRLMCSVPCLNVERVMQLPWFVVRDWLKRRPLLRRLKGKRDPFEFYEFLFTPATYRRILEDAGFVVEAMRTYGVSTRTRALRGVAGGMNKIVPFYNPHMMMAICRKGETDQRPAARA